MIANDMITLKTQLKFNNLKEKLQGRATKKIRNHKQKKNFDVYLHPGSLVGWCIINWKKK